MLISIKEVVLSLPAKFAIYYHCSNALPLSPEVFLQQKSMQISGSLFYGFDAHSTTQKEN